MKGLVRLYCLLMLGSFWVVPILNFIFDGFENFGYNIADILKANIMTMWVPCASKSWFWIAGLSTHCSDG